MTWLFAAVEDVFALGVVALSLTVLCVGCDDVRYREQVRGVQPASFQQQTVRARLSPAGLTRLYEVAHPEGLGIDYAAERVNVGDRQVTIGPLAATVDTRVWDVQVAGDEVGGDEVGGDEVGGDGLDIGIRSDDVALSVSLRVADGVGQRVCRYRVEADRVEAVAAAVVVADQSNPIIDSRGTPTVVIDDASVVAVGPCPPLVDPAAGNDDAQIDQYLVDYVKRAWVEAVEQAIAVAPLDTLGLVHTTAGLARVSNFDNRRGQLVVAGRVTANDGVGTGAEGLTVDLDMSLNSQPAGCAPALDAPTPATTSADVVPVADLRRAEADMGLAVATSLLARLAQTSALAGFMCRGLERPSLDGGGSNVATDELSLSQVGLGQLPVGPWSEPVVAPGALPEIWTDPVNGVIEMSLANIQVDLYAALRGVAVRYAQINADTRISLRPIERADGVDLIVDSVDVTRAELHSQWMDQPDGESDVTAWVRRVMLKIFDDTFSLPLPVAPGAPLHLVDSQVRPNDLLLLFDVDSIR